MSSALTACTSCDDRFSPHCGVMITSLLMNCAPDTRIEMHILDGGISPENKDRLAGLCSIRPFDIHFHHMDDVEFEQLKISTIWPVSAYYRFKVASVLNNISKVLYLDCDIVILEDPSSLISDYPANAWCCGVPDPMSVKNKKRLNLQGDFPYINSGVLVIDLDAWRDNDVEFRLLDYARQHTETIKYPDQDAINAVLRDHIALLPLEWNSQYLDARYTPKQSRLYKHPFRDPSIIHYVTSEKPWLTLSAAPRKSFYRQYLAMTPWEGQFRAQWEKDRKTLAPYLRRWKRLRKNILHVHLKKGSRFIRLFGITLIQDEPRF